MLKFFCQLVIFLALLGYTGSLMVAAADTEYTGIIPGGIDSDVVTLIANGWAATIEKAGYAANATQVPELSRVIANIILIFLIASGVIFLLLFVYGGAVWLTALGNDDRVGEAKKILLNAIIGIVIVLAAYSITYFVVRQLANTVSEKNTDTSNKTLF